MNLDEAALAFRELVAVIQALRAPGTGCPWDLEQDHRTLRPYLVEEAHEVLDAIDAGNDHDLRDELGDLLLQVVLHAQVGSDRGAFSIIQVVRAITEKMVRRHPHVFGSVRVSGSGEVVRNWEEIKAAEAREKGNEPSHAAALTRVPRSLPGLLRAQRLGEKAAKAGLDGMVLESALARVREEFAALMNAIAAAETDATAAGSGLSAESRGRLGRGLGDVLFGLCQLARLLGLNAEDSLKGCTDRFVDRLIAGRTEHE